MFCQAVYFFLPLLFVQKIPSIADINKYVILFTVFLKTLLITSTLGRLGKRKHDRKGDHILGL